MREAEGNIKFKMEMDIFIPIPRTVTRGFTSLKHLRQWQKRNDIDGSTYCFAHREYLLNEKGEWEQFTVIGKQIVTIGELEELLSVMRQKGFNQYSREEYEELMSSCLGK